MNCSRFLVSDLRDMLEGRFANRPYKYATTLILSIHWLHSSRPLILYFHNA